jgi:hypothetical protein
MHGEAADWALERIIEVEVVQEQEWIVFISLLRGNGTAQSNARAFDNILRFNKVGNGTAHHIGLMLQIGCLKDGCFTLLITHDEFSSTGCGLYRLSNLLLHQNI